MPFNHIGYIMQIISELTGHVVHSQLASVEQPCYQWTQIDKKHVARCETFKMFLWSRIIFTKSSKFNYLTLTYRPESSSDRTLEKLLT